jgi:hypothetical protein
VALSSRTVSDRAGLSSRGLTGLRRLALLHQLEVARRESHHPGPACLDKAFVPRGRALSRRTETALPLPLACGQHHGAIWSAHPAPTRRDLAMGERACDRVRPRAGDPASLLNKPLRGRRRPQSVRDGTTQRIHVPLTSGVPASITCCSADLDGPQCPWRDRDCGLLNDLGYVLSPLRRAIERQRDPSSNWPISTSFSKTEPRSKCR